MVRLLDAPVRWAPGASTGDLLRALARGGRRDVVHSHITKADYSALMAAPVTRGKRISTRHITTPRGYGRLAKVLAPVVRRALAREIAVSRYVSDLLERPSDVVLLNGVRPQAEVTEERQRFVLMAHRLAPEKDTRTGLRAWAESGLSDRGWRLVVAGAGQERSTMEHLAAELGITGSTDFVGWLADPTEAFRTAGIFLAPAPTEPCGLSILEAMAQGLPVVAAGSGGNPETVGQDPAAATFPPGDASAAAAHLVRLADDDDARRAYGTSLRRLQRAELSLDVHVDRLLEVYREVVEGR